MLSQLDSETWSVSGDGHGSARLCTGLGAERGVDGDAALNKQTLLLGASAWTQDGGAAPRKVAPSFQHASETERR